MSLFKKLFRGDKAAQTVASVSSQFHESEASAEQGSKSAPRRELVQLVLRDTMRRHGIPSDWIDCRILSMVSRGSTTGLHVHFIVRQAHDRLLTYVPAFQSSFLAAIEKFEPRVSDWLLSLSWQFEGMSDNNYSSMPDPVQWTAASTVTAPGPAAGAFEDDEMTQDLQALFAIRDAALKQDSTTAKFDQADFQPTEPSH